MQMPPESQGPEMTPLSRLQVSSIDKGSATLLLPSTEEEKIQKEWGKEPQQISADEVSGEGKMVKYPQQAA